MVGRILNFPTDANKLAEDFENVSEQYQRHTHRCMKSSDSYGDDEDGDELSDSARLARTRKRAESSGGSVVNNLAIHEAFQAVSMLQGASKGGLRSFERKKNEQSGSWWNSDNEKEEKDVKGGGEKKMGTREKEEDLKWVKTIFLEEALFICRYVHTCAPTHMYVRLCLLILQAHLPL